MDKKNEHINHLTPEIIQAYHTGKLTSEQMHQVEVLMLENPLYDEGMEGIESIDAQDFSEDIEMLTAQLDKAIQEKKAPFWTTFRRIAATLLLLVTSVSLFYILNDQPLPTKELSNLDKPDGKKNQDSSSIDNDDKEPTVKPFDSSEQLTEKSETEPNESITLDEEAEVVFEEAEVIQEFSTLRGKVAGVKTEMTQELTLPMASFEKNLDSVIRRSIQAKIAVSPESKSEENLSQNSLKSVAFQSRKPESTSFTVNGIVTASDDGSALPSVSIFKKGTTFGTPTDVNGQFRISDIKVRDTLIFRFLGYSSQEVIMNGDSTLDIALDPDFTSLGEVVITGVAAATPEQKLAFSISEVKTDDLSLISDDDNVDFSSYASAKPKAGYTAFNRYLKDNIKYPEAAKTQKVRGRVTLEFDVSETGELSNFKIVKGLGYGCDEEAIRLVKEGPQWNPKTEGVNKTPVKSTVKIRVRFRP